MININGITAAEIQRRKTINITHKSVRLQWRNDNGGIRGDFFFLGRRHPRRRKYIGGSTSSLTLDTYNYNRGITSAELQRQKDGGRNLNGGRALAEVHRQINNGGIAAAEIQRGMIAYVEYSRVGESFAGIPQVGIHVLRIGSACVRRHCHARKY